MENIKEDVVILLDEDGKETEFEHILTFVYEGERYVALSPMDMDASFNADQEREVIMLKIVNKDGEDTYSSIDNEVLLNEVFDAFLELMDEMEEDEDK